MRPDQSGNEINNDYDHYNDANDRLRFLKPS